MELRHHMQLVLQSTVRVKGSQMPLKDLLTTQQKQELGLGIVSTYELINAEHSNLF